MMGDPTPLNIGRPNDNNDDIARKLESVRRGQGGGNDHLLPALKQVLQDVAARKAENPQEKSGFTHIFSITDGGNNDYRYRSVNDTIEKILNENPYITFDSFFIDCGWGNYTKPLIEKMQSEGCKRIGFVDDIDNMQKVPDKIYEMLVHRMRSTKLNNAPENSIHIKLIKDVLSYKK